MQHTETVAQDSVSVLGEELGDRGPPVARTL